MTFTAVSTFVQTTTTTLAVNPTRVGNFYLAEILTDSGTVYCNAITGGNCTWTLLTAFKGHNNACYASVFVGAATATGSANATLAFSGTTPYFEAVAQQFNSSAGSYALATSGTLDLTTGTNTWPSLIPDGSGTLYFGFFFDTDVATAGSTPGYTYDVNSETDGLAFNPGCGSGPQAPVWADSNHYFGIAVLLTETPSTSQHQPVRAKIPKGKPFPRGRIGSNPGVALIPGTPATFYVSPTGSDTSNGTSPSTPWQTVTKVNSTNLIPGDTVLFQGGQTFSGIMLQPGQSGTASLPITFGSYGTGNATITVSDNSAVYVYEYGGITFENLTFTGPGASTAGAGGYVGIYFNRDLTGYAAPVAVTGCTITGWADGILVGAANAGGGYSGVTITGNSISANRDAGVNVYGSGYSHENVTITGNTTFNQTGYSGNTTTSSGHGIVVGNTNGGTVSQNVAYGNGASCGCTTAGPVGIWGYTIENVVFEYNVSYGNLTATAGNADGDGFDLDDQCVNCTLQYNIAYENDGAGIACYSDDSTWSGNVIRYNITWGNSVTNPDEAEIMFTGGAFANCDVYGNTFVGQTNAQLPSVVLLYGATFTNVNLWNNIFYTAASGVAIIYSDTNYTGITFQGNLYYSAAPFVINWGGSDYDSLALWRTGVSQEILSGHNTGIQANPQFNAPATAPAVTSPSNLAPAHGLKLAPGSPAAAQGLNLGADFSVTPGTQDFFGNPLGYPLWIGAFQGLLIPPAGISVRSRLPRLHPRTGAGWITSRAGAPLHNPVPGPVFRQATSPARIRPSLPPRGRVRSSPGVLPPTPGPVFRPFRFPVRTHPVLPPRGRVSFNPGTPVRNPTAGPVFRQRTSPAQARTPLPPRGRPASNPGAPVRNATPGPVFTQKTSPARIRPHLPPRGQTGFNPGVVVRNPTAGPVFIQAVRPIAAKIPLRPRTGGATGNFTPPYIAPPVPPVEWQFYGHVPVYYLDYLDWDTQATLYAVPGGSYRILIANTRAGLTIPPGDGRWILGDPVDVPLHRKVFLKLRAHIHKSRRRSGYKLGGGPG